MNQEDVNSVWKSHSNAKIKVTAVEGEGKSARIVYSYESSDGFIKLSPNRLPVRLFLSYFEKVSNGNN